MIYRGILEKLGKKKLFVLLIDPDKQDPGSLPHLTATAEECEVDLILVGGSLVSTTACSIIETIKKTCQIPVLLFPGSLLQISGKADGILLLSLISGRNPEYLIGNHVAAAPFLRKTSMEVISTGYILIENGRSTSVEYMSNTRPIPSDKPDIAVATAMAGEMLGFKMIYLEAGSGALRPVPETIVSQVKRNISIPLFVGGGISSPENVKAIYSAGADAVVVGTAVEENTRRLCELARVPRKK